MTELMLNYRVINDQLPTNEGLKFVVLGGTMAVSISFAIFIFAWRSRLVVWWLFG